MSHLIEVAFKGNRKEFYLWDGDDPPRPRAPIIVEGDRGEDLGNVHATGDLAAKRWAGVSHGAAVAPAAEPTKRALRLATDEEVRRAADLPEQNELARRKAMERVRAHALIMKVTDADWQWDRRKLTLYFTAEKRVDFRNLVRDLAALFRTRIELKQIGVRDEAKRLGGVGRCGREYCSASWLPELRPVNLSVAKDQRLSLNPTQISGACGRLMCSLRYEHEFYVQARKRFPKEGKILVTAKGEEKVVANDIFRDRVTLRGVDGETRVVPLADLRRELTGLSEDRGALPEETGATGPATGPATVDEPAPPVAPPVAPPRAPDEAPVPAVAAAAPAAPAPPAILPEDGEDDGEGDDEDDAPDAPAGEAGPGDAGPGEPGSGDAPRPRRLQGGRGGRRGRGGSTPPPTAPPSTT